MLYADQPLTQGDVQHLRPGDIVSWKNLGAIVREQSVSFLRVYSAFQWPPRDGKVLWSHISPNGWQTPSGGVPVILRAKSVGGFTVLGNKVFKFYDDTHIMHNGVEISLAQLSRITAV